MSSIWVFYVCLYVYEDSNFRSFRIPDVCAYAHKWLEHLASFTSGIRSELWPMPMERTCYFLTHGYSVGVFVSHRHHLISISAFFCVLIASSLLCAPGGNRLDQSRTSLVDFSREPVRPVYTLDLLFTCWNLHCENSSAFAGKEFIPVTFLSYTCNYYNRLYLTGTLQRLACIAATIPFLTSVSADNIPFL